MKVKHFFGLAVLAAMTASCSSNDELVNNVSGNEANEGKVGYAAFSINLPTAGSMTRAADAGGAEAAEGDKDEYAVKNATALIFQIDNNVTSGTSPSYKFVESVDLGNLLWESDGTDGITTKATKVAKLSQVTDDGSYYALILLNNKKSDGTTLKVALPSTGTTYQSWNDEVRSGVDFASNGIFMANAPLLNGDAPATLVNIERGHIYTTKDAAEHATTNTEIYVERGVAKVDVQTPGTDGTIDVKENGTGAPTGDKVKFSNWALDVTNKKTYAVHNYEGLKTAFPDIWTTSRFSGLNNRIYWAQDPNYSNPNLNSTDASFDATREAEFNYISKSDVAVNFGTAQYCLENTFDINNMNQGQTTRVVLKSVYTPKDYTADKTFYKVGKTMVKSVDDLKTLINTAAGEVLANCKLKDGVDLLTKGGVYLLKYSDLKVGEEDLDGTDTKQYNNNTQTGKEVAAAINAKLGLEDASRPEDIVGINTYEDGVTYYIARIKHFGDSQGMTPWKVGDPTYGSNNAKYLGRYGVLRNNWYELKVNSVSGLGYPNVPPVDPDMPDDENEKYISVSVKILDWAKRSQTVNL